MSEKRLFNREQFEKFNRQNEGDVYPEFENWVDSEIRRNLRGFAEDILLIEAPIHEQIYPTIKSALERRGVKL